ncbi:MAG TPA: hypothetical protein VMF14_12165 [Solirubrobacteraceae bacterium]|nr:hypothetical protein [Solirubrobacteraceae bacterium]
MEITVVYLAWAGAGSSPLEQFAASLARHPAGADHRLAVVWKGFEEQPEALEAAQALLAGVADMQLHIPPDGLDLVSYRRAADLVSGDVLCFLNTSSVVLADDWLGLLARHLTGEVGIVGATGSWESPLSGSRGPRRLLRRGRYPAFPNPHLRTNAFLLRRETLHELWWPAVFTKGQAWELESGMRSLTRQIEQRGLQPVVVGRDGVAYPRERWAASGTFRRAGQDNLLVADNRTRQFSEATGRRRRRLTRLAWGDPPGSMAPSALGQGVPA